MARLIEHIAPERKNQGHLGWLDPGQVVEVGEEEFQTAIRSDDFRAVETANEEGEEIDKSEFPRPRLSPYYDLTQFDWESPHLQRRLGIQSRRTLDKLAMAVEDVTGVSQPWGDRAKAQEIVNSITATAIEFGWTQPEEVAA